MKIIYLDNNYMCHTTNTGGMQIIETDIFDEMCNGAIECYRFIPNGQTWIRPDGVIFHGPFIQPAMPVIISDTIQLQYEIDKVATTDMAEALKILEIEE